MDDSEYSGPAAHQDLEGYHRDPDLAEILSGIRENAKILDGLWKLTATRKEGFAELLHGKEDGIRGRDYKSS